MDTQGKKAKKRPKRKEPLKMVYFLESTFDIWNKAKKNYSRPEHTLSSDKFAKFLLRCFSEGSEMGLDSSFWAERIDKEHCHGKTEKVKSVWSPSEPQYTAQLCHQGSGSSANKYNEGTISKRDTSFESFDVLDSNTDDEDSYSSSSASLDSSDNGSSDSSTDSSTDECATLTSAKETSIFIAQFSSEDDEGLDKEERLVAECKKAALVMKTSSEIKRFQDNKGYGKWFNCLLPLIQTRASCQPEQAMDPTSVLKRNEKRHIHEISESSSPGSSEGNTDSNVRRV
eukprot:gene15956-7286_t